MFKQKPSFVIWIGLCLLLLAQCTMQKRVYRKGWYISFKKECRNPGNDRSQKFETDNQQADLNTIASVSDIPSFESQYIENAFFDSVPNQKSHFLCIDFQMMEYQKQKQSYSDLLVDYRFQISAIDHYLDYAILS